MPFARPVTVIGDDVPVPDPPGLPVTVYAVMGDPPFAGAVKETVAAALLDVADTDDGAPGTVMGVTGFDAVDAEPVPTPFVAVTVNCYDVPFARPVTVMEFPLEVAEILSGFEIAV